MIAAVTVERGRLVRVQTHYIRRQPRVSFAFVVWHCFFKTGRYIAINVAEISIPFPNNNEFVFIQSSGSMHRDDKGEAKEHLGHQKASIRGVEIFV